MKKTELDIYVEIGASKTTPLFKIVEIWQLLWNTRGKQVILETTCWQSKDNITLLDTKENPPFGVRLIADNSTKVDPQTGIIVDPDPALIIQPNENGEILDANGNPILPENNLGYPPNVVGEYDFLRSLADHPTMIGQLEKSYAQLAFSRGRYDI